MGCVKYIWLPTMKRYGITIPIEEALKKIFDGHVGMETYAYCSKEKTGFFFNHEGWFYLLSRKL